jgi:hypothetical protein
MTFPGDWMVFLYQFHLAPARRRLFTLLENKLFLTKWKRSFNMESVLPQKRANFHCG